MSNNRKSSIASFLPEKECHETKLVQGDVPTDLHHAVKDQMTKDKSAGIDMNWTELIKAGCRAYLSERGVKEIP
jgi:hypothetical protein